ncbi:MAG TPA: hypothetical protein VJJ77_08410 [Dongiaceae bacterium]|nr:hypothetical protein [Dongiaceae bacterium]
MTPYQDPCSPYLARPRRGLRSACVETWLHRGMRPPCAACAVRDICRRDAGDPTPLPTAVPRQRHANAGDPGPAPVRPRAA